MERVFVVFALVATGIYASISNGRDMYKTGVYYALTVSPTDNDDLAGGYMTGSLCSYDRPTLATSVSFVTMRENLPVTNHNSTLQTLHEVTGHVTAALGEDTSNHTRFTASDGGLYVGQGDLSLADHFGFAVAISDYWLFTASLLENGEPGAIYVYFRAFTEYVFYQKIQGASGLIGAFSDFDPISDANANPWNFINKPGFNRLHTDREHFFIGDANAVDSISRSTGALHIYTLQDSTNDMVHNPLWELTQTIYGDPPSESSEDTEFGAFFDAYGNYLLVGASEPPKTVDGEELINTGAVYVYEKNALSGTWERVQKVTSPAGYPFRNDTNLGESFETPRIFTNRVAIGARTFGNDTVGFCSGRVYLYNLDRSDSEIVYTDTYLSLYDNPDQPLNETTEFAFFGYILDFDREWLAVGAPGEVRDSASTDEIEQQGRVLFYIWDGETYVFAQEVEGSLGHAGDNFGQSVSCDFGICAISAPRTRSNNATNAVQGVTYTFELLSGVWTEIETTEHNNPNTTISLGSAQIADVHYPWIAIGGLTQENPEDPAEQGAGAIVACALRPVLHYVPGPAPGADYFCYNTTSDLYPGESFEGEIYVQIYAIEGTTEGNGATVTADLLNSILTANSSKTNQVLSAISLSLLAVAAVLVGTAVTMMIQARRRHSSRQRKRRS